MGGGRAAVVAVVAVLAGCEVGEARCDLDGPPVVALERLEGVVTAPRLTVRGRVEPQARVEWRAGGAWQPAEVGADGAFELDVPTPEVDLEPFLVAVRATDARGRESLVTARTLVDRQGPTLRPAEDVPVLSPARRAVTVVPTDASGQVARLEVGGQRVSDVPSGAKVTFELQLPDGVDLEPLLVPVVLEDAHGNTRRETLSVRVDTQAPVVAWLTPRRARMTGAVQLSVVVRDAAAVTSVRFALSEHDVVEGRFDGVAWGAEVALPEREAPAAVAVTAVDAHGNARTERFDVTLDDGGPALRLLSPAPGALLGGPSQAEVEVVVEVDDEEPGACEVEVTLEGGAPVRAEPVSQGAQWSARVPLPDDDFVPRVLEVVARDGLGNVSRVSRAVLVDRVAPVLVVAGPAQGARLKRSDFVGTDDVLVRWNVSDGDASAAVRAFRGEPTDDRQGIITTRGTDDGVPYGFDVIAVDRAGNQATEARTFSVDRVAPSVLSLTPASGARNVEADVVEARFSEPVFGAPGVRDALALTPSTGWSGSWSPTRDAWRSGALTPATAFEATFAALADSHGNPLAPVPPLRFHTAAVVPASGATLASGVQDFEVAADDDGVVTLGLHTGGRLQVRRLSPLTGALEAAWFEGPDQLASVSVGRAVSPTTLASTRVEAVVTESAAGAWRVGDGVVTALSASALITAPPMSSVDGTGPVGVITQSLFARGAFRQALGVVPGPQVAQSATRWAALRVGPGLVAWSQLECQRASPTQASCDARDFTPALPPAAAPQVSAAMTPSGRCLVVAYESIAGRAVALAPPVSLSLVPAAVVPQTQLRVAPFAARGADEVLAAWRTASGVQVGTLAGAAACSSPTFAPLPNGALTATVRSFRPIQLGNRAALLYTDLADSLKVFVP